MCELKGETVDVKYIVLICIAAYLVGSINFATLIARLNSKDIRKLGSGNPGTMNVLRTIGRKWGILVFILDSAKGVAFALIGRYLINGADNYPMAILLGACVILGHVFPIFDKFRGGKGVATTIGVFVTISPIVGSITLVILIAMLLGIKYGFIGSLMAVTAFAVDAIILCQNSVWAIVIICLWWALVVFAHRGNIIRLIKGEENTLSLIKKKDESSQSEEENKEETK